MKRGLIILWILILVSHIQAQTLREFTIDTAVFVSELTSFTENSLESSDMVDFEKFLHLYDSLPYERRMEIIKVSNLMLARKCRPRPHFIKFQRVMTEFFFEDKTSHGYEQWLKGYTQMLSSDQTLIRAIDQFLSLTLNLLKENIFFESRAVTWKVSTPSFHFEFVESMKVRFDDVTVACYSGRDFIQIKNATGYIDPHSMNLIGSYGRVTWERVGMPETEMQAILGNYSINLMKPGYAADSVRLIYPALFEGEVLGHIEDKVTLIKNIQATRYPRFVSYKNSYRIDDFIPGIDYRGGLSIEGANLVGSGVEEEPAVFQIFSEDTLRVKLETYRASMNGRFIRANHARVSIYFGEDSIFHPDLVVTFDVEKDLLRLNKSEDFTSQGPYSNSYQGIDMNFDELLWNRSGSTIKMQALQGSSIGRATFESNTFFNYDFFLALQGMDYEHPLSQLKRFSDWLGGRTFAVSTYANHIGFPAYQVRHQLMSLSKLGFVYFDDETDLVTLRQKLFDYMEASRQNRDYDVIRFNSRTQGISNAEFNLDSRDLTIKGIPVIFLSDSQNVRLIPREKSIVMKRNRSFQFDGIVDAGLFRFTGQNFFFDYDSFKINLQKIDSLQISIQTGNYNQYGEPILTRIDNAIENMTGELLIDAPDNKSGLENYPQYPTFSSREKSFIYFDSENIQGGIYDRDEFYFELEPFTFDSLDNFNPEAISPRGTFISAGILPPMEMEMTLRDDNSLGFYMRTEPEGISLYGGVGTFYNDIEMSSKGLHAYGSFDYLTSTTWSDDFLMEPDSMVAKSRRFLIREKLDATEFPYVENTVADVKFIPGSDVMKVSRIKETFNIFNDSIFHAGNLALRPEGLSANGVMALPEARLESENFTYESRTISADSAGIRIRSRTMQEFPFLTDDVNLFVDLDARLGEITANADFTRIELPYNLYETRLDQMTWYMDRGEVLLTQKKYLPENDVDIGIDSLKTNGPTYRSLHTGQEGLNFVAPSALYNYRSRLLFASQVPFIEVADAFIFPYAGEVEVGYQASMGLLNNARVLANKSNRQHQFYNASIAIDGAKDYRGSGYYEYRDAFENSYPLYFDRIWVDSTIQTRSRGTVEEDDPFMMSPFFDFQGELFLFADNPYLTFDGGTRIVHNCDISRAWLRFTAEINPMDIRIPVSEQMQNMELNKIFAGSMITRDSTHIYSTFISGRKDYFDANITSASGKLIYDPARESYIITTPEKLADTTLPGKYLRLDIPSCQLYSEGPIDLTLNFGHVKLTSAGNTLNRIAEDEFTANLVLGLDFHFSPDAMKLMGSEIDSLPDLEPVDLTRPDYQLAMRDLLGETQAKKLERELALTGVYNEIPPAWKNVIFFNELPLRWNQESRSFRRNGKVGIGNIGNIQINKKVDAYIELIEKGSGDIFDIYIMVDRNTWYYFAYSPGGMQVLSSNERFNSMVFDLKASERRFKAKRGEPDFIYSLAAKRRLDLFIERFLEFEDDAGESEVF